MRNSKIRLDLVFSLSSQFFYKLLGFGILAILTRHMSQSEFGELSFVLAVCTMAVFFTDIGYNTNAVRQISCQPEWTNDYLGDVLTVRVILLLVFFITVNIVIFIAEPHLLSISLIISLSAALKDLHRTFSSVFIAVRKVNLSILSYGLGLTTTFVTIYFGYLLNLDTRFIPLNYVIGSGLMLWLSWKFYQRRYTRPVFKFRKFFFKEYVFSYLWLFLLSGLHLVHLSIDTVIIGIVLNYQQVAEYTAAFQLFEASQFTIRPLTIIFFPICAQLVAQMEWSTLRITLRNTTVGALLLGFFAAGFVYLFAELIVGIVYPTEYNSSARLLQLLYASTPALFVTTVGIFLLNSLHMERSGSTALVSCLIAKLILLPLILTKFGLMGAAWYNFVSHLVMAILMLKLALKKIKFNEAR